MPKTVSNVVPFERRLTAEEQQWIAECHEAMAERRYLRRRLAELDAELFGMTDVDDDAIEAVR